MEPYLLQKHRRDTRASINKTHTHTRRRTNNYRTKTHNEKEEKEEAVIDVEEGWISQGADDDTTSTNNNPLEMEFLITIALLSPEGYYEVVLDANNPYDKPPVIQLPRGGGSGSGKYLSPRDVMRLSWGINKTREIMHGSGMRGVVGRETSPGGVYGCGNEDNLNDWVSICIYVYVRVLKCIYFIYVYRFIRIIILIHTG